MNSRDHENDLKAKENIKDDDANNDIQNENLSEENRENGFYLIAYDDKVYVYQSDMKRVYLVTNISIHDLPEQLTQEIMDKKYIKDEAELYNFLESYSS